MKKFKKLIPAMVMLLIATMLMGTTTYAWFSMNSTVTATGMQVVAKSDNTYLLISKTNTSAATIQSENVVTVDMAVADTDADVYPSAPVLSTTEAAYVTTSGKTVAGATITTAGVQVTNATTAAAVTNWYTANALAPDAATIDTDSARQLTSFTDYVITKTVYLTVAAGANGINNLTVTPTFTVKTGGADLTAAKVLITTSDGGFAVLSSANNGSAVDIKGTNTTLTDTTVRTINIYIYYDGNVDKVYTNNMANLKGVDISLSFSGTAVPAGA